MHNSSLPPNFVCTLLTNRQTDRQQTIAYQVQCAVHMDLWLWVSAGVWFTYWGLHL